MSVRPTQDRAVQTRGRVLDLSIESSRFVDLPEKSSSGCRHNVWKHHMGDTHGWCRLCKKVVPCE